MHAPELATRVSVAVLSDSRLFRETIAARLKLEEEIHLLADAGSVRQLLERLNGSAVDVILRIRASTGPWARN